MVTLFVAHKKLEIYVTKVIYIYQNQGLQIPVFMVYKATGTPRTQGTLLSSEKFSLSNKASTDIKDSRFMDHTHIYIYIYIYIY